MAEYALVFTIGLLGSVHCLGMCGGFVLAISGTARNARQLHLRQLAYFGGKTLTYILLGAVAGAAGAALGSLFTGFQSALSIAVGLLLIGIGVGLLGFSYRIPALDRVLQLHRLQQWVTRLLGRGSLSAVFGLGLVNGLLPCGLVYAMVATAVASGSALAGAATMAVFGLATVPALYGLGLVQSLMRARWRARLNLAGGVLVILLGLMTVVRGTPLQQRIMNGLHGSHDAPAAVHAPEDAPKGHMHHSMQ